MSETSSNPYATDERGKVLAPSQGCSQKFVLITVCVAIGFLLIGLMLPAVRTARPAARRMQCSNNLKQIGLAVANYEAAYRQLPPAYTIDPNGKPLHSWRTLILPYLEQAELYAKVDLTKPWDDPANDEVRSASIGVFQCPAGKIPPGHNVSVKRHSVRSVKIPLASLQKIDLKVGRKIAWVVGEDIERNL